MQSQIQQQIQSFLRPFLSMSSLSGAQFPILPTTYTLWRKVCYHHICSKHNPQPNSQQLKSIKRAFIKISQRKLLPQFYQKIQKQIDGKSVGWRKAILNAQDLKIVNSQQYQDLLFEYCQALYQLELMIEMFYDLVSIQYSDIYKQNKKYLTNQKYKATLYSSKNETLIDKACNKIGKNIVSKGLGKISQAVLSNKFIYSMTGALGVFNPLASLASLSISYAMQSHEKYSKVQNLVTQLEYLNKQTIKHVSELREIYQLCLGSIDAMARLESWEVNEFEKQKRKFNDLLGNVLDQDWLQVKTTMQGEWELVQLRSKYSIQSFDDLPSTTGSSVVIDKDQ